MEIEHYGLLKQLRSFAAALYRRAYIPLALCCALGFWGMLIGWGSAAPRYDMTMTGVVNPGDRQAVSDVTLTNTCVAVLQEPQVYAAICRIANADINEAKCKAAFYVESALETAVFRVTVTWTNAQETAALLRAFRTVAEHMLMKIDAVESISWVEGLDFSLYNSGRGKLGNGLFIGALSAAAGLFLSAVIIATLAFFDTRVYSPEQALPFCTQAGILPDCDGAGIRPLLPPPRAESGLMWQYAHTAARGMRRSGVYEKRQRFAAQALRLLAEHILRAYCARETRGLCILLLPDRAQNTIALTASAIAAAVAGTSRHVLLLARGDRPQRAQPSFCAYESGPHAARRADRMLYFPGRQGENAGCAAELLKKHRGEYDLVIMEGCALEEQPDTFALLDAADLIIPVLQLRMATMAQLEALVFTLKRLQLAPAAMIWTSRKPKDLRLRWQSPSQRGALCLGAREQAVTLHKYTYNSKEDAHEPDLSVPAATGEVRGPIR